MSPTEKTTYIAFLRAINVGGRFVKMDSLRNVFTSLGFTGVRTHIQSGNVFFESELTDRTSLKKLIETSLHQAFHFEVPVLLRTIQEVESTIAAAPFSGVSAAEDARFCVIFLEEPLPETFVIPFKSDKREFELISAVNAEVFAIMYITNGRPGNPAAYIEKRTRQKVTARFLHTTVAILEAAKTPKSAH